MKYKVGTKKRSLDDNPLNLGSLNSGHKRANSHIYSSKNMTLEDIVEVQRIQSFKTPIEKPTLDMNSIHEAIHSKGAYKKKSNLKLSAQNKNSLSAKGI